MVRMTVVPDRGSAILAVVTTTQPALAIDSGVASPSPGARFSLAWLPLARVPCRGPL